MTVSMSCDVKNVIFIKLEQLVCYTQDPRPQVKTKATPDIIPNKLIHKVIPVNTKWVKTKWVKKLCLVLFINRNKDLYRVQVPYSETWYKI